MYVFEDDLLHFSIERALCVGQAHCTDHQSKVATADSVNFNEAPQR